MSGLRQTRYLVSNSSGTQLGVLHDDGSSAQIPSDGSNAIVSSTLQSALRFTSTLWASAVEPQSNIGMTDPRVEGVALSSDGSSMLNIALNDKGVLRARSELAFPDFVTRSSAAHPVGRNNPIAFYSSAAGGVFMLGGTNPASGAYDHDIWFRQMNNDWWPIVPSGYTPDRIIAATYSFADQRLYLLEHTVSGTDTVRLVRIDFRTANAQTLATCTRGSAYANHFFSVDKDGSLLVASSNATSSIVGHLATDANGNGYLSQEDVSEGGLIIAPIVDNNGYSFITGTTSYITTRRATPNYGTPGNYSVCQLFP